MAASMKKVCKPVVVILGATGTGKSKLALELAKIFNGEILSADSMQVYHGLDIITNKVTAEERRQCRHHLLDYVSPLRSNYTVTEYRNEALPIIDTLHEEGKLPIIVGGTNYYIESLIWKFLLDTKEAEKSEESGVEENQTPDGSLISCRREPLDFSSQDSKAAPPVVNPQNAECQELTPDGTQPARREEPECNDAISNAQPATDDVGSSDSDDSISEDYEDVDHVDTAVLYQRLSEVDPGSAQRLHPNNRRKIIRALQVFVQSGVKMTDLLAAQHKEAGTSSGVSGPLRYQNTCVVWIQAEQEVLDKRTDARVDQMMEMGLIEELTDFHEIYNKDRLEQNSVADYTQGIFQSIGFKEFHKYLIMSTEERGTSEGKKLFNEGVEEMKRVTRKYARKQRKWIVNRFLKRRGANVPLVYAVDASDPSRWQEMVYNPAVAVISASLKGLKPEQEPMACMENTNPPAYNVCHVCGDRVFVTTLEWTKHLAGRKHKKAVAAKAARERRLASPNAETEKKEKKKEEDLGT